MLEIGRLCIKTAGRDAGKKTCIVDIIDSKFVLIDGATRRRKCNVSHLEPLDKVINIKKNASHEEIKKEFLLLNIEVKDTKPKTRTERPKKQRKKKEKSIEIDKKETKKEKTKNPKKDEKKKVKKETPKLEKTNSND